MSKLQNNYTTKEQSERLLELGVPKWTADFYMDKYEVERFDEPYPYFIPQNVTFEHYDFDSFIPCWSVGRLMEIFAICFDPDFIEFDIFADGTTFLQQMIDKFETYVENMDFSKLEE